MGATLFSFFFIIVCFILFGVNHSDIFCFSLVNHLSLYYHRNFYCKERFYLFQTKFLFPYTKYWFLLVIAI